MERAELLAALECEDRDDPLDEEDLAWVARAVARDPEWVRQALGLSAADAGGR